MGTDLRFTMGLTAIGLTLFLAGGGCAAGTETDEEDTTGAGGDSPTTGMGGAGATMTGTGGATDGGGGEGAGNTGLCDVDCSTIQTPDCNIAVCNEGMYPGTVGECVVVPDTDGVECEDGDFCTVDDSCQAGVCVGGTQNDCGMDPSQCNEIVCDETTDSCSETPATDGTACNADNLCLQGATCSSGVCTGGTLNDCFFAPVPDECHVAVCNPTNGMCEAVVGNDGQPCTDPNELCTVDKICNGGACVGGVPKDCSSADAECVVGICDMATGNCIPDPLMPGASCPSAVDECNTGVCDMNGLCQPNPTPGVSCPSATDTCNAGVCDANGLCAAQPANEGGVCDDADACTTGETCGSGVCGGGLAVTTCSQTADGCCPGNCTAANDLDCACSSGNLTAPYNRGNGLDGNMFDVVAKNNIEIQGFDVSIASSTTTIEIYYRPGTHVGFETSATGWTLAGSAMVTGAGLNQPTPVPVSLSITIPAGQTYGFYVTTTTGGMDYTNGTAVGNVLVENADLQILEGKGNSYPFGSSPISTREWNGTIYYEVCGS